MNIPFSSLKSRRFLQATLCAGAMTATFVVAPSAAQAAKKARVTGIEPWQGRRTVLLLPLQLGEGWNADRNFGQAILSRAEQMLEAQLQSTGKFSVIRAQRFNPLVQRALQEKRLTEEQVTNLIQAPTLENATAFLTQFTFDRPAMIADFRLEEVRGGGTATQPSVQAQVSGRLYELGNPVAFKSPVVTSDAVRAGRNNIERYLSAADNAFDQAAAELVAPIQDIEIPMAVATTPAAAGTTGTVPAVTPGAAVAPGTTGAVTTPVPAPTTSATTGAASATSNPNAVPQLPAARPPLGITVPDATGVR
jgi:hypothetical protein